MPLNFNIEKVLLAPLDWGLGHATRCIPIIRALQKAGCTVIIAAEGAQAALLHTEFPELTIIPLTGYRVRYSRNKWFLPFKLLLQAAGITRRISAEHKWLNNIIDSYKIDLVISDNRYGLYSKKVSCIFITHQLTIKAPFVFLERILQKINYRYINRFTCCWVPDSASDDNLAGRLAHPDKMPVVPVYYIGLLARFGAQDAVKKFDGCFLLSGPEPQRTILEKKIIRGLENSHGRFLLIRGKPGTDEKPFAADHVEIKNHLPGTALRDAILQSEYIISRSGYTTVMELAVLQKKSILIPTPGQTEQEYLAKRLAQHHFCIAADQDDFDFNHQFELAKSFHYLPASFPVFDESDIAALLELSVRR